MQFLRICKLSIILLATCAFIGIFVGCGKKAESPVTLPDASMPLTEENEDSGKLAEIKTSFGTLYIPQKYEQLMQATTSDGDNSSTVKFFTEQDGKTYILFEIGIGEENGQLVGALTDKSGVSRDVFVAVYDLGDISELSKDKQDQLYAMQEAVNVVIENLK